MKKLIIATAAFLLAAALWGCGGQELPQDTENTAEESSAADSVSWDVQGLEIVTEGKPGYVILLKDSSCENAANQLIGSVKAKTGVSLQIQGFLFDNQKEHVIYFGNDFDAEFPDSAEKLTGYGYAVLEKGGDIYVCANDPGSLASAVTKFLTKIGDGCVTENEGKKSLSVPSDAFFVYNPGYDIVDAKLMNVPLSEYRLVYEAESATAYGLAFMIRRSLTDKTGYILDMTDDSGAAAAHEILIGDTVRSPENRLKAGEYRLESASGSVFLQYGSYLAAGDAVTALEGAVRDGKSESIAASGEIKDLQCLEKEAGNVRIISSNTYFGDYKIPNNIRSAMLAECYALFDADFIGIQEARNNVQFIAASLSGYEYVTQTTGHTPIFYKTSAWQIAKDDKGNEIKGVARFEGHCWSAEWVMFRSKTDASLKVIVMNLHIHPRSAEYRAGRPDDIAKTNAAWKQLLVQYPDVPVFTTGDYNSANDSNDFRTLLSGLEDKLADGKNVAADPNPDKGLYTYHDTEGTNKAYGGDGIDHIVVTKNLAEVRHYRVIQYAPIGFASDHFPIFIDVSISK